MPLPLAIPIIAAIAGAGASAYGGYQASKTARRNTDKTIAANSAEAEKAYQRDVQMWNMQNAYNHPAQQMARYQAAGLNPHMVGQSGTGAGNATNMVKYNPPTQQYNYQSPRYGEAIAQVLPMVMQVGEWMQSMKMSEEAIKGQQIKNLFTATQDQKQKIAIDYMLKANPQLLEQLGTKGGILKHQQDKAFYDATKSEYVAREALGRVIENYGDLFSSGEDTRLTALSGLSKERIDQARSKSSSMRSKSKIDEAQASYTDYNITNPQSLINLVVGSVMSMATGSAVKLATPKAKPKTTIKSTLRNKAGETSHTRTFIDD